MNSNRARPYLGPRHEKRPHQHTLHDDVRHDDYAWMKERDSPEVLSALRIEEANFSSFLAPRLPLIEAVHAELFSRTELRQTSVPTQIGSFLYYTRFEETAEHPTIYRRAFCADAPEEVVLDIQKLATGKSYCEVAHWCLSPDHKQLAFCVDFTGRRLYELHVVSLQSGQPLIRPVTGTGMSIAWFSDNENLLYIKKDQQTLRAAEVHLINVKTGQSDLSFRENDERYSLGVYRTLPGKRLFLFSVSTDSAEMHFRDASEPHSSWACFHPRAEQHQYFVIDAGDRFLIRTNLNAANFRLCESACKPSAPDEWREVISHRDDVLLDSIQAFPDHIVVRELFAGSSRLQVLNRRSGEMKPLVTGADTRTVTLRDRGNFESQVVQYVVESVIEPPTTCEYHLDSGVETVLQIKAIPNYQADHYETKRIWVTGDNDVRIPVTLAYRRDSLTPGSNPLYVQGYGAYGSSLNTAFRMSWASLLDRGFVCALVHVRGGSELGRAWYDNGRLEHKTNSFSDFIAGIEGIINAGYAAADNVVAAGTSAGGLLIGAVVNQRPDLCRAAILRVPFVDVLTTMCDPSLPLTVNEYNQWGNPNERDAYYRIKSYSPYDNIRPLPYPTMLLTASYHDSQVPYWEPLKFAAKLRDHTTSGNPIIVKVDMNASHGGRSGRFEILREIAEEWAFMIDVAGAGSFY